MDLYQDSEQTDVAVKRRRINKQFGNSKLKIFSVRRLYVDVCRKNEKVRLEEYHYPISTRKIRTKEVKKFKQRLKINSTNYWACLMMMNNGGFYVYTKAY